MQVRTRSFVMWGIAAALMATTGCRSTSQDRIRVLEAERSDLSRENDRLKGELADERSGRLETESRLAAKEAELSALAATAAARGGAAGGAATSVDADDLSRRLAGSGVEVRSRGDGSAAIVLASDITFGPGRADLNPSVMSSLKRVAQQVRATPGVREIRIEGHTDTDPIRKSGWKSNEELSRARADMVRKFLISQGIDDGLLSIEGYGPTRPLVQPERNAADKAKNRRVEVILVPATK